MLKNNGTETVGYGRSVFCMTIQAQQASLLYSNLNTYNIQIHKNTRIEQERENTYFHCGHEENEHGYIWQMVNVKDTNTMPNRINQSPQGTCEFL